MERCNNHRREQWVDVARGFAMLCVILGHMDYESLNIAIFSFHMPLLFFLAGYFQRSSDMLKNAPGSYCSLIFSHLSRSSCSRRQTILRKSCLMHSRYGICWWNGSKRHCWAAVQEQTSCVYDPTSQSVPFGFCWHCSWHRCW